MKKLKVLFLVCLMALIYPISSIMLSSVNFCPTNGWSINKDSQMEDLAYDPDVWNFANYNDTYLELQWGYFDVGANIAHQNKYNGTNTTNPSDPVIVAVLDTGVDYTHPDIAPNYIAGGYDFANDDSNPMDDHGHGTHCAGIIAAVANNTPKAKGVAGIAPGAKIMAYKILRYDGAATQANFYRNLSLAFHHILTYHDPVANPSTGVDVISMSVGIDYSGGPGFSDLAANISAATARGIIIVAAAGNDYRNWIGWPARFPEVIAIGASNILHEKSSYSNYGPDIDFVAPGGDWIGITHIGILSTYPGARYAYMSGTSMATPMAAGIVAVLRGNNTPAADIYTKLNDTALDLGTPGKDNTFGWGLLQLYSNAWPREDWLNQYYGMEILLGNLLTIGSALLDFINPAPPIDWVTWIIIIGVIGFFAVFGIIQARRRY